LDKEQSYFQQDMKLKILVLWIFVFFNMIFRDLHEFGRAGFIQELTVGVVNGVQITDFLLLIGGIMMEVPLLMLPITILLKPQVSRLANICIGTLMIPLMISTYDLFDPDDIFFLIFEVVALSLVIWYAWRWPAKSDGPLK
jgi:predicted membrane channel-forming protein YqfA (hemolysin III family)